MAIIYDEKLGYNNMLYVVRRFPSGPGVLAVAAALALAACGGPMMDVAEVPQKAPLVIPEGQETEAIEFAKIAVKITRGTRIGTYEYSGLLMFHPCLGDADYVYWNQGRVVARDIEFADMFYEALSDANYNVVGDPNRLFNVKEERRKAVYAVGAQIKSIEMNVCDGASPWDGHATNRQSGRASVKVNWQVYSKLQRRVVYETTTEGSGQVPEPAPSGERIMIQNAFAAAAANFAADPGFRDLVMRQEVVTVETAGYAALAIPRLRQFVRPVAKHIREIQLATVTLDFGTGFGSGFIVSKDGLLLTNYHVVGNAKRIKVRFPSGLEVVGEVLRSHRLRDVALVRVPVGGLKVLPIRAEPVRVGEEVFAIGTPLEREYRATFTKGIISAVRVDERTKLETIQGDVDIQGGNSGGPLVDERGNVVAISVAGIQQVGTSIGLNFFIPILDALEKLNMRIGKSESRS